MPSSPRRGATSSQLCAVARRRGRPARRGGHQARRGRDLAAREGVRRPLQPHRDRIDGVLVCLPNFGDEKGVADALKLSGLNVPVLVQAYPDDLDQLHVAAAARRVLRQDLGLQQPAPVRRPVQPDRRHTIHPLVAGVPRRAAEVPRRLPRRPRPAPRAHRRDRRAAERVQHHALQREAARSDRHQRQHARPLGSARRRAPLERRRPQGQAEAGRDQRLRRGPGRARTRRSC